MKRLSLFFTALLCVTASLRAQTDLVARIHFLGGDKISADPASAAFTNEFCSAEAKALESQTLDKLSRTPGEWFKSKLAPGAGDGSTQLRPLLDDLLKSEWVFEIRDVTFETRGVTNGLPEYALAIRLNPDRAQVWSKILQTVLQNWTGTGISQDKADVWELKKSAPSLSFQFSRLNDWVVIDCGQDKLSLREEILKEIEPHTAAALVPPNWLTADLNWPRLAQLFPSLKELDFPKIAMQIVGRDGNLQWNGKFTLSRPLPPLENWRAPTNLFHQPLITLTAVRGIGPWLARQPWMQPFLLQPQPDQLVIWSLAQMPFQTFAAEPVPDSSAALAQLDRNLSANTNWQSRFMNPLEIVTTNNEMAFVGMPFIAPYVQAVHSPAGDFLLGGFFPNLPKSPPLPPELFAWLSLPDIVYYHWEITAERLKELPQLSQLLLMFTQHQQLDMQSSAGKWASLAGSAPGVSITKVTRTAPGELTFTRSAPAGLTAVELFAFASWLDATNFPGCDLRLPEVIKPRPPRRPVSGTPTPFPMPPAER